MLAIEPDNDRIRLIVDLFVVLVLLLVSQWLLRKICPEPDKEKHFWPALVWNLVPYIPVGIYSNWLRHFF